MPELHKDEAVWPIAFRLVSEEKQIGRWTTLSWSIEDVCLYDEDQQDFLAEKEGGYCLPLQLHMHERSDYRFNLSSRDPHLFIVCVEENETLSPLLITAAQGLASGYMDGDYQVLHIKTPIQVQAWMEAYIGRHGELLEFRKKRCKDKNKDKKGRSSGN
ncbi:DUF3305 domain-containing protein [Photobacterium aphoticum]|uniref:DUF3305 domain-containing protein n=1 Tax=Photobacterium aphoticum TaxID=754436 RepID=A0A090R7P5_9GAMM|nr:DUF3305 domain-containing protein [Photobacterium aphoticum]KLV00534.1 hypothetical protein ABT58_12875 [Photobacterium aphoticum]PSU59889.1 DUF3305 domain-containing protein [Photobacterium aphoticum]GAL03652.1 hypothetical protein JCM19237_6546 [Photobacterium aphoticum]GHA41534.1 hypothetical protein GCM10007086_13780 [Photobacterium aphoticum]